uniref:PDZ domain-containing protein n=1 Tax=Ditylenchus dipsaci TaxID=166011 RepID=A0A915DAW9_9BILA
MSTIKQARNAEVPKNCVADGTKNLIQVKLRKAPNESFGFNLVGGTDQQHLAARTGRLEIGDIIVSVNGVDISAVIHDDAIALFRSASICEMVVEKNGEQRILSNPPDFPDGPPAAVNEMAMKFFQDESESSRIDKPDDVASGEINNVLSDDESFYTPLNSPGSAKFSTRHQLLRGNQGSPKDQGSSSSSLQVDSVKREKVVRKLSFSPDEQEETACNDVDTLPAKVLEATVKEIWHCKDRIEVENEISEGDKQSDEQSSAKSSCSSKNGNLRFCEDLPSPTLNKKSPLEYLKQLSIQTKFFSCRWE